MTITIPDTIFSGTKITQQDLLLDFATYLYEKKTFSIGQAKKMVGMDLITFQKELAKRNIFIHYELEDLEKELKNLDF
jgi:predicted HTH domain antitoxin